MLPDACNDVFAEEAVLLAAVIGDAQIFERCGVDVPEFQLYSLPDFDRRAECKAVYIAQALRPETEPVRIMSQRFQRLHLYRAVLGHRVVTRIR